MMPESFGSGKVDGDRIQITTSDASMMPESFGSGKLEVIDGIIESRYASMMPESFGSGKEPDISLNLIDSGLSFNDAGVFRLRKGQLVSDPQRRPSRFNDAGVFRLRKGHRSHLIKFSIVLLVACERPRPALFGTNGEREVDISKFHSISGIRSREHCAQFSHRRAARSTSPGHKNRPPRGEGRNQGQKFPLPPPFGAETMRSRKKANNLA
jgi:hypothetical protein